jgi:methionine-S-sulfoxide reductase
MEKSSFAAGCFWGVEHAFKQIEGVTKTEVGYQGGESSVTTYAEVCSGQTGHAEVVEITFDPNIVSYKRLLEAFVFMHNPGELNRQGPDIGTQYRSALFPTSKEQEIEAIEFLNRLKGSGELIVTTIEKDSLFISGENKHQDYLDTNPAGYCHIGLDVFMKLKKGEY